MKIAIFNPYKKIYAAENSVDAFYEQITKVNNIDINIKSFCSTEEIVDFNPEFILSHSSFAPKFCHIPTYTIINEATIYRLKDKEQFRSFLTFDGYLTQSKFITEKLEQVCFDYKKRCHILKPFANTRPKNKYIKPKLDEPKLTYFGNNWEVKSGNALGQKTPRFETLFKTLAQNLNDFELYGDPDGWSWVNRNEVIKGKVSFDNPNTLLDIYNQNGVGLALSSHEFYSEDLANNRIYEIVSSGAICIADDLPFYKDTFGDSLLYITSRDEKEMSKQIIKHLEWIKSNKELALAKAKKAHEIFCSKLCSERMLEQLIAFHYEIQEKNYYTKSFIDNDLSAESPLVSVVVRSGGRAPEMVARTLDSIKNQSFKNIELVFILYKENQELEDLALSYKGDFSNIIVTQASSNIRSTLIFEGINKANGDYIALLDDDDIWYKNHISKILEMFHSDQTIDFVYSGKVYQKENSYFPIEKEIIFGASNSSDLLFDLKKLTNSESKYCLGGFDKNNSDELLNLNNPIHPVFIVKKDSLTQEMLKDPELHYAEDLYFCALLYKEGLKFQWMPELTMQMNIHETNSNNDTSIHYNSVDLCKNRIVKLLYNQERWTTEHNYSQDIKDNDTYTVEANTNTNFDDNMNYQFNKRDYFPKYSKQRFWWPLIKFLLKKEIISNYRNYNQFTNLESRNSRKYKHLSSNEKTFLSSGFINNNPKISFVASSRYRGNEKNNNLNKFIKSLLKNSYDINNIELLIALDNDDDIDYFIKIKKHYLVDINIKFFISNKNFGYKGLHLYDKFLFTEISPSSKMIADFSDDCEIKKRHWDKYVLEIDKKFTDNIYFIHTEDFGLEKYIGPLDDNITKMIWSYKSIAPSSYFPIFSRKVLEIATNCLKNLDSHQEKLWSPIANSYICDCYVDILSRLVQTNTKSKRIFSEKIISINKQIYRKNQSSNNISFHKNIGLCWDKTGLNTNDQAFLKLSEQTTLNHLKFISNEIVKELDS